VYLAPQADEVGVFIAGEPLQEVNLGMTAAAQSNHQLRIFLIATMMNEEHRAVGLAASLAGVVVPLEHNFPVAAKVGLRVPSPAVTSQTQAPFSDRPRRAQRAGSIE
jgi:hypothetical protein